MKFECKKCGWCCQNFSREKKITGLPLFEWEKEEFEKLALKRGIRLKILPTDLIFDKRSGRYVCINYSMKDEPCPFLKNNQCSIYLERPLVCKAFPLAKSPMLRSEDGKLDLSAFMKCENFDNKQFMINELGLEEEGESTNFEKAHLIKKYSNVYGDEILINSSIRQMIWMFVDKGMRELIKNKKVKFRKVSQFDLHKYKTTSIFDFFVITGLMNEKAKEETIRRLRNPSIFKEAIDELKK